MQEVYHTLFGLFSSLEQTNPIYKPERYIKVLHTLLWVENDEMPIEQKRSLAWERLDNGIASHNEGCIKPRQIEVKHSSDEKSMVLSRKAIGQDKVLHLQITYSTVGLYPTDTLQIGLIEQ